MKKNRDRLIFPLACCAIVSVATFSGIGIAAITGQLAVTPETDALFSSNEELNKRISAGEEAATSVPAPTHVGLTRSALRNLEDGGKPKIIRVSHRFSQTLKPACSRCGVVDSIEPHALQMPTSQGSGNIIGEASFAKTGLSGTNQSTYAAGRSDSGAGATSFIVRLRMEDGSQRTIYEHQRPKFSVGEKVKLINGSLVSMS